MKLHKTTHTQLAHWFGFISAYKLMFVCGIVVPWPKICSRFNTRRVVKDTLSKAWFTYLWHAHGLCQVALPFLFVCWWAEPPVAHLLGMTISIAPAIWITFLLVVALTWWFPVFCPPPLPAPLPIQGSVAFKKVFHRWDLKKQKNMCLHHKISYRRTSCMVSQQFRFESGSLHQIVSDS